MRKFISFVVCALLAINVMAQLKDPVKWSATSRKNGTGYEVVLTATLPKPWHIYSQTTGEGGPIPTTIKFTKNPLLTFDGSVKEVGKLKENFDKLFDTKVKYYGEKVDFVQAVKVRGNVKTNVNVTVEYMTCDDSQCLPPTKKTFNVSL
ncbi:MAG: cytochrome c-type biosis protein DsbD, protein-disulfide reductase [Segetibacter sp.]|jgi:DsbC/DsbD-like thiol-disulfide interchange protein|nr:cytochrome c-type biosis protein DsbD, protein-disulfide reductase [Segetibacter sp.]